MANVSDKMSGGPKQGIGNQRNRDLNTDQSRGSSTGNASHGSNPKSAGLDRGRSIRPDEDQVMDSAVSGRSPLKEPERRGNIYDPEHPNPDRNPSI